MLYSVLCRWSRTAGYQLVLDIFEQIVHLQSDCQWSLDQKSSALMLNSSFSSHIALATAEYTAFVIDESFVVDDHKLSSCSDNDEFYLDFWFQIYSQSIDEQYQNQFC